MANSQRQTANKKQPAGEDTALRSDALPAGETPYPWALFPTITRSLTLTSVKNFRSPFVS
jgi:hypothetical protein